MKQSINLSNVIAVSLVIILSIAGLTTCVEWNIGGFVPLVIALCTLGTLLLMAYAMKVEAEEEAEFTAFFAELQEEHHPMTWDEMLAEDKKAEDRMLAEEGFNSWAEFEAYHNN